jgi:DNA-binding GntR family transcriptional regulator
MAFPEVEQTRVSDRVYGILRQKILSKQLLPGERLDLDSIEQQLKVSMTPIKMALDRLAVEGLVEIRPRRGTYVSSLSQTEIAEAFDVRGIMERYALELAVRQMNDQQRQHVRRLVKQLDSMLEENDWNSIYPQYVDLDHELHRFLVQAAGNRRLLSLYDHNNVHVQMARARYTRAEKELAVAQKEHEELLRLIERKQALEAAAAVGRHIERAKVSLLRDLHENDGDRRGGVGT